MYRLNVTYRAESRAILEQFLADINREGLAEASRAEDGCVRYDYYFAAEKDELLLIEYWADREAQQRHGATAHFKRLGEIKQGYGIETELVEL